MERSKAFAESDVICGWDKDPLDIQDHRVAKYLREHQRSITNIPLPEEFKVGVEVILPKTMLIDFDATTSTADVTGPVSVDRGDVYEAFWRTSQLTIRGIFINSEPVWGEVQYSNGMSFVGGLLGGRPHGFGVKRLGASVYKGRFNDGDRHGRGILLDSNQFCLYIGGFVKDQPHGVLLRITFCWCTVKRNVQHTRSLVKFDHGTLLVEQKAPVVNVSAMSGLAPEEFLQFYREGEKALEDSMVKNILRDANADPVLWQPVGL